MLYFASKQKVRAYNYSALKMLIVGSLSHADSLSSCAITSLLVLLQGSLAVYVASIEWNGAV